MRRKRYAEVDFLRGLAVVGMVVFHFFYILDFYGVILNEMYEGVFLILARVVQFVFIGLVGVSLAILVQRTGGRKLNMRCLRRGIVILLYGYGITLATYVVIPDSYVRFGILHLIGLGVIVFSQIAHRKYLALIVGLLCLIGGIFVNRGEIVALDFGYMGYILGLNGWSKGFSIDYFSVFPWFALIGIGVYLGHFWSKRKVVVRPILERVPLVLYFGRNSLMVYLIHVPLILLLFVITNIISLEMIIGV